MIQNHDLSDLKRLLVFEEKNLVRDFYLLNFVKNFDPKKIAAAKKNLNFIQNFSAPTFPLNGNDVISLEFKGSAVGKAVKQAKIFWIKSDFKASKAELMRLLASLKKSR
jgi:tRNA nucleotidyltransferase/poly(A) polymerase